MVNNEEFNQKENCSSQNGFSSSNKVAQQIVDAQESGAFHCEYPQFTIKHRSLLAKFLTPDIYHRLKHIKTSTGYTLDKAIQIGVDNPHLQVGIVAGDEESYVTFKEIFDPIIESWHDHRQDTIYRSDLNSFHIIDARLPDEFVISTRIRVGRNIHGIPLSPAISHGHRQEIMELLQSALSTMTGDLEGTFYKLSEMTSETEKQLIDDHYLFQRPREDTFLTVANAARDWPSSRGIFYNKDKTFLVWCNEEDHIRIISMQNGGDTEAVFERFCRGVKAIEKSINSIGKAFMFNDRYGFICTCPTNIGTSLRASVLIKLPKLSENYERFVSICNLLYLEPRGTSGEDSSTVNGMWDISNKQRIGHSETELVQTMINGVKLLITMEVKLIAGESIDKLIPIEPVPTTILHTKAVKINKPSEISIAIQPTTECNYPEFILKHQSLAAKHLTKESYEKFYKKSSSKEYTLDQTIQIGIDNPCLDIGVVAGDEEWHEYKTTDTHHTDVDVYKLRNIDKSNTNYIISTKLSIVQNIRGLSLRPGINRSERLHIEKLISITFNAIPYELKGKYYHLDSLMAAEEDQLEKIGFLFKTSNGGILLKNAEVMYDWSSGRSIFHKNEKTVFCWINEIDHMRVMSIENGGNIVKVFTHLTKGHQAVEQSIKHTGYEFMYNNHLNFLSASQSNEIF